MGSFTPPPTTQLTPGDHLDRYELLCILAQGGMGTVWLARMTGKLGFERLVALKTILPTYSSDRQFCDMFLDEARIAARLDHENVARILEIGEDRGLLYYAMELIDGESLRKLYRDVRSENQMFPLGAALRIIADACAGLHATHELRGEDGRPLDVVHRDVSPQNLLVTVRGTTKLIDFGVAKANARRSEETEAGTLKGKIEYMAPEQARSEPLDRRADIYAVGAVLYELLAGKPVRDTGDGRQLLALHELMTGVSFAPLPPSVPNVVRKIVDRALARDPRSRFASADELRQALEEVLATMQGATANDVIHVLAHFSRERTAKRKDAIERAIRQATEGRVQEPTLIAPLMAPGASPRGPSQGSAPGDGPYPTELLQQPFVPLHAGPAAHDGSPTGPSMRTFGAASMSTQPAASASAARAFAGGLALVFVALLGVLGGVMVTHRNDGAATVASPRANPVAPETTIAAPVESDAPPPALLFDTPPPPIAGPRIAEAGTSPRVEGVAAPAALSPRAGKDGGSTGGAPRRPSAKPAARPAAGAKPSDGDEYGF